jgi:hypothetical protein
LWLIGSGACAIVGVVLLVREIVGFRNEGEARRRG